MAHRMRRGCFTIGLLNPLGSMVRDAFGYSRWDHLDTDESTYDSDGPVELAHDEDVLEDFREWEQMPEVMVQTRLLLEAIWKNDAWEVRDLVEGHGACGANPNTDTMMMLGRPKRWLLHEARDGEVVSILVANGADVENRGEGGRTALADVIFEGAGKEDKVVHDTVVALIAAGADVHARDDYGTNPMDLLNHTNIAFASRSLSPHRPRFWRHQILVALLRGGALVENMQRKYFDLVSKFGDFPQFCANRARVWVSVITKGTGLPDDEAGVVASFVSPRGGYLLPD